MSTTAAALTALAVVVGLPVVWCHGYRTHARVAAVLAERAARPPGPHAAAIADEIALGWQALNETCCLRNWEAGGRTDDHDRATCTRKDQTT
ncbi:hypothetical protein [Streptomyces luteogriseus]|uniref:hypothetical protein n=1 Tax=Streptomyces luteogriseus TaxID=68233 RepID=UPI003809C81F